MTDMDMPPLPSPLTGTLSGLLSELRHAETAGELVAVTCEISKEIRAYAAAEVARERERWEAAMKQTWCMIDPFNPAGVPGSYARGQDSGIVAALTTVRANYVAAAAIRSGARSQCTTSQPEPPAHGPAQ